MLKAKQ